MPSPADDFIAAGNAAYQAKRFHEAIDLGRRAVTADPDNPWAHNLLGAACAEEMEFAEARRAFAAAVAAGPDIPLSHVNHAYALILDGAFAEAEAALRTVLRLDPAFGPAFINLSWIYKAQAGDALIGQLEALRACGPGSADAQTRVQYAFALGKFYDDIGEYDRAFACFREGNELSRVACDIDQHARVFARTREIFTAACMRKIKSAGWRSDKPVFIVGMPRCGSSLLEDRLARRADIGALGERPDISRIMMLISANHPRGARYPDWASELPAEAYARFGRHYVETMEARFPTAARLVDKNLLNFKFLGMIAAMLPDAAIVHCRRSALDTCLSGYFQLLRPEHDYKFALDSLGRYYRLYMEIMDHWRDAIGGLLTVRYEDFVSAPDAEFARVAAFLGLGDIQIEDRAATRSIQTSSAFQVRQPVTKSSIRRWRNYEKHLGPLIDALGDLAET